jgi:hypothetical protein
MLEYRGSWEMVGGTVNGEVLLTLGDEDIEGILCTGCDGSLVINQISRHCGRYLIRSGTDK